MQGHLGVAMWSRGKSLEAMIDSITPTEVRISPPFILHVMDRSVIRIEDFCSPRQRPTRLKTRSEKQSDKQRMCCSIIILNRVTQSIRAQHRGA